MSERGNCEVCKEPVTEGRGIVTCGEVVFHWDCMYDEMFNSKEA